jgi:ADP-heptose:LPS heptosyltransferase
MKILVIRFSSIGDVILVAPLFSYLCAKYPAAAITFVTEVNYVGLFTDDPRVAEVVGIDKSAPEVPTRFIAETWDLIVDLQNSSRSRTIVSSLKTASPVGYFDKLHWKRSALLFLRWDAYDPREHVAQRYLRAAGASAKSEEAAPVRLYFREGACLRTHALFRRQTGDIFRPAIALFPFSAWKNKEWPVGNFINVGRYFLTKGWNVAIMGGVADVNRADRMKQLIGNRCVSLVGKLSLFESGCLLTGFTLALGNDTGMSHLARASGVKTGIIYGPTTRHFGFYPYGEPRFKIFEEKTLCRPCHAHGGNVCPRFSHVCMKRINYRRVIEELVELAQS